MNTIQVKAGTKAEFLEYLKTTGKNYTYSQKEISDWIDAQISRGHNMICLDDLTHSVNCSSGIGCYVYDASEMFFLTDFRNSYFQVTNEEASDMEIRERKLSAWKQLIRMEEESERRDAEYRLYMAVLKDIVEKIHVDVHDMFGLTAFWSIPVGDNRV